jgi:hypothetical protein
MKLILSPVASTHTTTVSLNGLTLVIDGTDYDLSQIPPGGQADAPPDSPFIGIVTRNEVTIRYHYDSNLAEPQQSTDWANYIFEIESGPVPCPIIWRDN